MTHNEMFLNKDELFALTGVTDPFGQREMLRRMQIPYFSAGHQAIPLVNRCFVTQEPTCLEKETPLDHVAQALTSMESEHICAVSRPYPEITGVYFLIDVSTIVYVGQSFNVLNRVAQHGDKVFTRVAWVACPPQYLDVVETAYIRKLQPKYNRAGVHKAEISLAKTA